MACEDCARLQRAIEAAIHAYQQPLTTSVGTRVYTAIGAYRNEMKQTGTYTAPGEKG